MTLFNKRHITSILPWSVNIMFFVQFPRYYHFLSCVDCLWPWKVLQL